MGNQIQYQAYLFSWAYLHHANIVILEGKKRYDGLRCSCDEIDKIVKYKPYYNKFIVRVLQKLSWKLSKCHWCPGIAVDLSSDPKASMKMSTSHVSMLVGWYLQDTASLVKCSSVIRKYFAPETDMVERLKRRYGILEDIRYVGVHIRRGDYNQWKDGKFYLNDDTYRKYMEQYYHYFCNNTNKQRLCFLLFSDEEIDVKEYKSTRYQIMICNGSATEDLCAMISICAAIIGPPSTFSGMASFLGDIPKYVIDNTETNLQFDAKSVVHIDIDDYGKRIE